MLSAIASTTSYINPSSFTRANHSFGPAAGYYSGRGYVAQKQPVWPQRPLGSWETNTALELSNVVYPDGTVKNASAAQSRISDDREKEAARAKIANLEKQANAPANGAIRAELLDEIEKLQHKYFQSELNVNELRAGSRNVRDLGISAAGHAVAAERQRQDILNELKLLTVRGLVGGIPVAPAVTVPRPRVAPAPRPVGSGPPTAPASSGPTVAPTPGSSAPTPAAFSLAAPTPSSAPSIGVSSPLTTFGPTPGTAVSSTPLSFAGTAIIPVDLDYQDEDKAIENIAVAAKLSSKPSNTQELVDMIYAESDSGIQKRALMAAANELDTLPKSAPVMYFLYQLALVQEGLDPAEYSNLKIDGRLKKYSAIRKSVQNFKNRL